VKSLNPEFKNVLTTTTPGNGLLFGDSLNDALKEIDTANKMTARLSNVARSTTNSFHNFGTWVIPGKVEQLTFWGGHIFD
jgi:hypothetical protein